MCCRGKVADGSMFLEEDGTLTEKPSRKLSTSRMEETTAAAETTHAQP
jgi:hypothetical protein